MEKTLNYRVQVALDTALNGPPGLFVQWHAESACPRRWDATESSDEAPVITGVMADDRATSESTGRVPVPQGETFS